MSADMKLGINVGYWQRNPDDQTETVRAAERLGYDSVFTAEAYGSDAFSTLAWYGARTSTIKLGTAVVQPQHAGQPPPAVQQGHKPEGDAGDHDAFAVDEAEDEGAGEQGEQERRQDG